MNSVTLSMTCLKTIRFIDYLDFNADQPFCSMFMNDAREWAEQIIIIIIGHALGQKFPRQPFQVWSIPDECSILYSVVTSIQA